jgi:hypothetical protein
VADDKEHQVMAGADYTYKIKQAAVGESKPDVADPPDGAIALTWTPNPNEPAPTFTSYEIVGLPDKKFNNAVYAAINAAFQRNRTGKP